MRVSEKVIVYYQLVHYGAMTRNALLFWTELNEADEFGHQLILLSSYVVGRSRLSPGLI